MKYFFRLKQTKDHKSFLQESRKSPSMCVLIVSQFFARVLLMVLECDQVQ